MMSSLVAMTPSLLPWVLFSLAIIAILAIDLGIFHRKNHVVSIKEASIWSLVWIGCALIFNLGIYFFQGSEVALTFTAGYLIELSLSIDNLFVFVLIFSHFRLPERNQHQVLFWGILGALVMRLLFIIIGIQVLKQFHWMIYILGVFLVVMAIKFALHKGTEVHLEESYLLKLFRKWIRIVPDYHGDRFFIRKNGKYYATQLFTVLVVIEATDLVFALDSIPAIFGVTTDPFIVYTSNVFAILGLRSMFFALSHAMKYFCYLHEALSIILLFIGVKMLLSGFYHIPISVTLSFIAAVIIIAIGISLIKPRKSVKKLEDTISKKK